LGTGGSCLHCLMVNLLSKHSKQSFSAETFSRALATMELLMLRRHLLSVSDFCFSANDLLRHISDISM